MAPAERVGRAFEVRRQRLAHRRIGGPVSGSSSLVGRRGFALGQIDAAADDVLDERAQPEFALTNWRSTSVFQTMPAGAREHVLVDAEPDRRLVVRRRHEQALRRRDAQAQHRRRVEIREEHQHVVVLVVPLEVLDERRATTGPCCFSHSISSWRVCGLLKIQSEYLLNAVDVARARVGEPAHGDAADPVGAFRVLVLPGDVVARARRQHLDLVPLGEALGDQAGSDIRSRRGSRCRSVGR